MKYSFDTLSSDDFELLTRDLLQKHLDIYLDNFKSGRDGGIDLKSSTSKDKSLIVQCKHYLKSTYSNLITELKKEAKKVLVLKPSRYIVVTSQGLTQKNKEEIKQIFEPFIKCTEDIFSAENLNNLLSKYPEIERKHFKLWLSSQNILDKIIHNDVMNKSENAVDNIKKKISLYVQNQSFHLAKDILTEMNYCIIAGAPGIGKTTLADILILDYMANDYEIYKITNINEAFKLYHQEKKQMFYYDDFLGQTSLEIKLNQQEDSDILQFISLTKKSKNTKFVLTTREYILNQAKLIYEKLETSNFDFQKCVIDLDDYTKMDKARILFNHFFFSEMPREVIQQLLKNKNYLRIINHTNYSPRIIEQMTVYYNDEPDNYVENLLSNLNNPLRIWEHPFNNQISNCSRNLLLVIASLPADILLSNLKKALDSFEKVKEEHSNSKDFNKALKELEGNFINISFSDYESDHVIRYNNPSIKDFVENYMTSHMIEFSYLCQSPVFFDQIIQLWNFLNKKDVNKRFVRDSFQSYTESIRRCFTSPDLKIKPAPNPWDEIDNSGEDSISLFDRFFYVLDLSTIIPSRTIIPIINHLEEVLYNAVKVTKQDSKNFLIFLAKIDKYNYQSIKGQRGWIKMFKMVLWNNLDNIYTFNIVTDFLSGYPLEFDESEIIELKGLFKEFHKNEIYDYLDEASSYVELEDYLSVFEEINNLLEIETAEDLVVEIENKRHELSVLLHEPEPDYDEYNDWEYFGNRNEDSDIDSLFEGLKDPYE